MADITPESTEQAQAAQTTPEAVVTTPTATDHQGVSFDDALEQLVTARSTGAGQDEISRLEAIIKATNPDNNPVEQEAVESNEEQQEEQAAAEEQAEVEQTETETTEEEGVKPSADAKLDRIRLTHLNDADRALMQSANLLAKARGIPIKEAFSIVSGETTPAAQEEQQTETEQQQEAPPEIVQLQAEIADIEARLDAAAENGELFTPEIKELNRQQSKAYAKLAALEARHEAVREAAQTVNAQLSEAQVKTKRNESLATAVDKFPGLKDDKSRHWKLASELAIAAQNPSHPDHKHSISVDAPEYFATKAAEFLDIAPRGSTPKTVPPSVPSTTTQQTRTVQPAPGSRQSAPPPPAKSTADKIAEIEAEAERATTGAVGTASSVGRFIISR